MDSNTRAPSPDTRPPSARVGIRKFELDDAEALFALTLAQGADLDGFAWRARIESPKDETAFVDWSRAAEANGQAWARAILVDGKLAGCSSLYEPHPGAFPNGQAPTLQMGYWVARHARGLGASWRAMELLSQEASPRLPEGSTLGIRTRSKNGASLACAARLGLSPHGIATPSMFDPDDCDLLLIGTMPRALPAPAPRPARP